MNTNILASNAAEIKTDNLKEYGRRALQTRKRRQAAGKYKRPTKAQQAAFAKAMQSRRLYGDPVFSVEELQALATHPSLLPRQREQWAAKAEALAAELEADDYAEDMLDREDWSRGQW